MAEEKVQLNALKHGILSQHTVLPHEDQVSFDALLSALVEEHDPQGKTEEHLVEELAGIMWRKQRVLIAEGALINRGIMMSSLYMLDVGPASAPFDPVMAESQTMTRVFLGKTPRQVQVSQEQTKATLDGVLQAKQILKAGGKDAFSAAIKAFTPSCLAWWKNVGIKKGYSNDRDGLASCIDKELEQTARLEEREAHFHDAVLSQAAGEGVPVDKLANLGRYETHLDRKFERTLGMLIKLQQIRGRSTPN